MRNCLLRYAIFAPVGLLLLLSASAFAQSDSTFTAIRLNNSQPIIDQAMFAAVGVEDEGENINGPSMIRIPDWIPPSERAHPSAVYYLYFAHHVGDYIRMAWATDVEGPWTFYQTGAAVPIGDRGVLDNGNQDLDLGLGVVIEENHLASPDVLIDNENQQIIMYFHSGSSTFFNGNEINSQNTWVSTSDYGLEFLDNIRPVRLGSSYFRVFSHGGDIFALDNSGFPRRALDPNNPWQPTANYYSGSTIPSLWDRNANQTLQDPIEALGISRSELRVRHTGVRVVGDEAQVFYTQRGDLVEEVLFSTIDLTADYDDWELSYPGEPILEPIPGWEGGQFAPMPSETGSAPEDVNQLRDPDVFEDTDGMLYLIYAGRGEDALGIALLRSNGAAEVVGRHVFYNDSFYDGNDTAANSDDDSAIATDKVALLAGETATPDNITNFSKGINGIIIDVVGLANASAFSADDIALSVGVSSTLSDLALLSSVAPDVTPDVSVRVGGGVDGSDRITITLANRSVMNEYLQVRVLANGTTGLSADDVFYFGNVIGDTGNSSSSLRVDASDLGGVQNNLTGFFRASVESRFDFNRDGRVDATDLGLIQSNLTGFFSVPLATSPDGEQLP